jgi:MFS family permease
VCPSWWVSRGTPRLQRLRQANLSYALLVAVDGTDALGVGVLFPLLARIQAAHHLGTYALGLMSGGYFFASVAAQLGAGRFLDGRRARPVLLAGVLAGAVSLIWFAVAGSLWALVASRAVGGASLGIVGPAVRRAATVGQPPALQGRRLGFISSVEMTGIVLGPLVGSGLASFGVGVPFMVLGVLLAVLTAPLAWLLRRDARTAQATTDPLEEAPLAAPPGRSRAGLPARRPLTSLLLLAVAGSLPTGMYDALWSRLLTDRGATTLLIGLSLTLFGVPFMALAPFAGRLAARGRPTTLACVGLIVSAAFMAVYGVIREPVIIVALGAFEACAVAVAVPAGYAAVAALFPDDWAATGQGWYSGVGMFAAGTAALVGAPAYHAFGPFACFAGGAAASVVFSMASLGVDTHDRHPATLRPAAGAGSTP